MEGFWIVLVLAALPAAGNFFGGILAEFFPSSGKVINFATHAATGVVLGVVGLELLPEAMKADPVWVPILAFVFGGVVFIGLDAFTNYIQRRRQKANKEMLGLYTSVALDLLSDGIMVGTATVINPALGLLLAAGQVPADVPEGFATAASLRRTDINRSKRLLILASFALPVLIGAIVGYFALKNAPEIVTLSVLALTGGALASVVLEEVLTESHKKDEESRYSVLFLVGGFALFAWVSAYFG